jgi:hypothetical protein
MATKIGVYPNVPLAECVTLGIDGNYYVEDAFSHKRMLYERELEFPPSFNKEKGYIVDYELARIKSK